MKDSSKHATQDLKIALLKMNNEIEMNVKCTSHFLQRFSERVCPKSRRRRHFAEQAYRCGESTNEIKNCHLRRYCEAHEIKHGTEARVYHGFIYWFHDDIAITVTPIPKTV